MVTDNATGSPHSASLSGTGVAAIAATASLSVSSLIFGMQLLNKPSVPKPVTLTNTSAVSLSVTSITTSGNFAQTNTCGTTLAAGLSCTISVTFTPTAFGTRAGTLTINDNASGSPQTVSLSGMGI